MARSEMFQTGDIVSYEDMANPRQSYRVVQSPKNWSDFCLQNVETGEYTYSDLRQSGWRLEAREVAGVVLHR